MRRLERTAHLAEALKRTPRPLGLVPSMGYLHQGHLSLVRRARAECETVAMSIFVNPTQFGPHDDYERYPRDPERDATLAAQAGVNLLFLPSVSEMYPAGFDTWVEVGEVARRWEGEARPGHFRGVATVVLKLLDLFGPERAYFGEKDYQQLQVVRRLVVDLKLGVEIVGCPTVRDPDGLALSSRNGYLSPDERQQALAIPRALLAGQAQAQTSTSAGDILEAMQRVLREAGSVRVEYLAVVDPDSLERVEQVKADTRALIAARVGQTRLIDNVGLLPGG